LIDELATAQLASIRYEINPRGLVEIESKDEMRKRGVKSPDRAEAIMLAFADRTPGMLAYVRQTAEHQQAVEAAIRQGKSLPEDPWNADDLIAVYDQVCDELERGAGRSTCPKCGGALG
jgi:hypothetical protein